MRVSGSGEKDAAKAAAASEAAAAVRPFGKYFLVRKLAEGGMAEIFLAKQVGAEGFERNVVIKRMLQHLSSVQDFVAMFLDEARLASRLGHQNIVQINDLGLADGCYYICMEYLAGEDFSYVLRTAGRRREYVPLSVVCRVIADAAHGLHFAHEFADESGRPLNVVHRDISPSNIFVTYQGQVKLLDFGIAKAESRVTNTTAGVVKGKYMYMAPEQARGVPVDRRADVFSLGVSLYESLTNVRPFAKENDLAVLNAVLTCDFQPPRKLRPDLPPELEAIVLRAMAAQPDARYSSAGEMALDLERFLQASSSTGGGLVSNYLRSLFEPDRISTRSRIPTLASLAQSGVDVPGFSNPYSPKTQPEPESKRPDGETMVVGTPSSIVATRPPSRGKWFAVAAAAVLLAGGGGFLASRMFQADAKPLPPSPTPVAVITPPLPEPVAQVDAGTAVAAVAPDLPVDTPRKEPDEPRKTVRRTVKLTPELIQRELGGYQRTVSPCFVEHRGNLPSSSGQIPFDLTIVSSGKVTRAKVTGPLAGTAVGQCVQRKLSAMRFPKHSDSEISLSTGFAYSVQ